jgi:hypothetical protein
VGQAEKPNTKWIQMALETRNGNGRYYTRSIWRDGRVHREYVGKGAMAELAALADLIERDERRKVRQQKREAQERVKADIQALETPLNTMDYICQMAMMAAFELAGYHRPKRWRWRKRRV